MNALSQCHNAIVFQLWQFVNQHEESTLTSLRLLYLQSNAQLDGALEYLKAIGDGALEKGPFEEASGVGVVVRAGTVFSLAGTECP